MTLELGLLWKAWGEGHLVVGSSEKFRVFHSETIISIVNSERRS